MINPDQNDSLITEMNSEIVHLKKSNFFWMSAFWRFTRITLKMISNTLANCWNNIFVPLVRFFSENISKTYQSIKTKKEKQEIRVGNYLNEIESNMALNEARQRIKEVEAANVLQEYERKIKCIFDDGLCNAHFTSEKNISESSPKSLDYGLEVFDFISHKLKESCLVANIEYMNVSTKIEKLEIVHMVEFELKISGQSWASIFSKFVSSEVFKKIEWAEGKIDCHHLNNVTLIRDTFILTFSHKRLELIEVASSIKNIVEKSIVDPTLLNQKPESSKDI